MAGGAQQGADGTQGGGQQMPSISPQSVSDMQNLLQYYQQNKGQFGGMGGGMGQSGSAPQQFNTLPARLDQQPMRTPPPQGAPVAGFGGGPMGGNPPPVQNTGGPDMTGNAPSASFGFDRSGSDAGVGGNPVTQVQSPYQPNRPPMMSDFRMRPQQGLQIQGNPTERQFQPRRPRSSGGMFG